MAGRRRELDAVEVKYRRHIDLRGADSVAKSHPGRPAVIVTREDLRFTTDYALVPARLLLWTLG